MSPAITSYDRVRSSSPHGSTSSDSSEASLQNTLSGKDTKKYGDLRSKALRSALTLFTKITPLPRDVPRRLAIEILHDHDSMIKLNPHVIEHHIIKTPRNAPADESIDYVWHKITDGISYQPGIEDGKVSYKACFYNSPLGLITHTYYAAGAVNIEDEWSIGGNLPGKPPEPRESGVDKPLSGLYLREDRALYCDRTTHGLAQENLDAAHTILAERIIDKATGLSASERFWYQFLDEIIGSWRGLATLFSVTDKFTATREQIGSMADSTEQIDLLEHIKAATERLASESKDAASCLSTSDQRNYAEAIKAFREDLEATQRRHRMNSDRHDPTEEAAYPKVFVDSAKTKPARVPNAGFFSSSPSAQDAIRRRNAELFPARSLAKRKARPNASYESPQPDIHRQARNALDEHATSKGPDVSSSRPDARDKIHRSPEGPDMVTEGAAPILSTNTKRATEDFSSLTKGFLLSETKTRERGASLSDKVKHLTPRRSSSKLDLEQKHHPRTQLPEEVTATETIHKRGTSVSSLMPPVLDSKPGYSTNQSAHNSESLTNRLGLTPAAIHSRFQQASKNRILPREVESTLSRLGREFVVIELGDYAGCRAFIEENPRILEDSFKEFVAAAQAALRADKRPLAKSCIQQALLLRRCKDMDCKPLSRTERAQYFYNLVEKDEQSLKDFKSDFEQAMERLEKSVALREMFWMHPAAAHIERTSRSDRDMKEENRRLEHERRSLTYRPAQDEESMSSSSLAPLPRGEKAMKEGRNEGAWPGKHPRRAREELSASEGITKGAKRKQGGQS